MFHFRFLRALLLGVFLLNLLPTPTFAATTHSSVQSGAWSDPQTWDTHQVPGEHAAVLIESSHTISYDVHSTAVIDSLEVEGGLRFAENKDTLLTVDHILVTGLFEIGTASNPLPESITATVQFKGDMKEFMSLDGQVEIHGTAHRVNWTHLEASVEKGATQIALKKDVNWKVGDQIVIAPTGYDPHEAEQRTITRIEDENFLTLDAPLQHQHLAESHKYAEVGLLTHNIQFLGENLQNGGHMMFMGDGPIHIEEATFDSLGHYGTMAKYALHFHLMDGEPGSYIKGVSIVRSANRCVTIHGTFDVLLQDNVAYDTQGHCYFLEDGIEERNRLIHNLGVLTRKGGTLDSDVQPATFWITNPNNTLKWNSAAGSETFGYWYMLQPSPSGFSEDSPLIPQQRPLGKFDHNTAHSNLSHGFTIDNHGFGEERTFYEPPQKARFSYFTAYSNVLNGIWARGKNLEFIQSKLLDNKVGASFPGVDITLRDSLIVGDSGTRAPNYFPTVYGYEFYDGKNKLFNVKFEGFHSSDRQLQKAISTKQNNPYLMSPFNDYSFVSFKNTSESDLFYMTNPERNGDKTTVVHNFVTGKTLLTNMAFHKASGCQLKPDWNAYECPHINYGSLRFYDPRAQNYTQMLRVTRLDTGAAIDLVEEGSSMHGRFVLNVPAQNTYRLSAGNIDRLGVQFDGPRSITVRIHYSTKPARVLENEIQTNQWSYDETTHELVLPMNPKMRYQMVMP